MSRPDTTRLRGSIVPLVTPFHDGRLDAVRVGRVLRVHKQAVDGFLARQRIKPSRD